MEAAPESGLLPRLEGVYTPTVHADVPARGEGSGARLYYSLPSLPSFSFLHKISILDTLSEYCLAVVITRDACYDTAVCLSLRPFKFNQVRHRE